MLQGLCLLVKLSEFLFQTNIKVDCLEAVLLALAHVEYETERL